ETIRFLLKVAGFQAPPSGWFWAPLNTQRPERPAPPGEDPMIAGRMTGGQPLGVPQQVVHRSSAGGQDGREQQNGETAKGRLREGLGHFLQERVRNSWYTDHMCFLAWLPCVVCSQCMVAARQPLFSCA